MGVRAQKKRQNLITPKVRLPLVALLVAFSILGLGGTMAMAALENEKDGVVRSVQVQDAQIEVATLVIGSHLIHIDGLTDELYETAMESANEFNQSQMYYKSELAGGAWFEITDATSIADISTAGTPVDKSVIEALEFTHKTGANGITTDLRTGQAVSLYNIMNPYNLMALEELEPLRVQYQILQEKTDKNDSDAIYLEMIRKFFENDIQNDKTKDLDISLDALENYKRGLSSREKPAAWKEKTDMVMASVDAERRIESLNKLSEFLEVLNNNASGMGEANDSEEESDSEEGDSEEGDSEEEPPPKDFFVNSEIVSAIGECIQNVETSITTCSAKCMTDSGDTTSAKAEYRYCQELIEEARIGDVPGCDRLMEKLCNLQNILDGLIVDQRSELETLVSDLVQAAYTKYVEDLQAGISQEYRTAKASGSAQAVLAKYLTEQKTATNADRLEYQTMLDAQFQRMGNASAQSYVLQLIDGIPALEQSILRDAAQPYLEETLEEHLQWLRKAYAQLVKEASDGTEMELLEQQKEALAKQRQDALDRNDLATANKLLAEMEAKQKDMDTLAANLASILNSANSSEADKAKARAGMGSNNTSALLSSMADDLSSAIRSGEDTDLQNQLAALSAVAQLDPNAGAAALQQVSDALSASTGLDANLVSTLGDSLANAQEALEDASDNIGATGGLGTSGNLSAEALNELINDILEELFGSSYKDASDAQKASAMLAIEWYGEQFNNSDALNLAASLARLEAQEHNPYIYEKYTEQEAYISLQAIGNALGYRYIFSDVHDTVTLQKAKKYYFFALARESYETVGKNVVGLSTAPGLMNTLYIHGEDSVKIFDTKAEYIKNASYGVVGTPEIEADAQEIYDSLMGGGA